MITLEKMRHALAEGEFFLEYLPTISLADGRCTGAEALVRWRQPSGEIVQPDDFIPIAENTPLSGLITYWALDQLAEELGVWLKANPEADISINVPPEILGRGGMEYVAAKSGLLSMASQLVFEITERGVPDNLGVEAINNIWGMGLRVALDDVTLSGGANLAVLARCNFQIVKLDKELIAQVNDESHSAEWVDGVRALLRCSPRLIVIAEGVETERQLNAVRAAEIPYAQGFHFSRPLRAPEFMRFFAERTGTVEGL